MTLDELIDKLVDKLIDKVFRQKLPVSELFLDLGQHGDKLSPIDILMGFGCGPFDANFSRWLNEKINSLAEDKCSSAQFEILALM